jgi:hypothetical protein
VPGYPCFGNEPSGQQDPGGEGERGGEQFDRSKLLKGGVEMPALTRGFARVDKDGKLSIPNNIRREVGFQPGQLVEVKVVSKKGIIVAARKNAR